MHTRYLKAVPLCLLLLAATATAKIIFDFHPPNTSYSTETVRSQYRVIDGRRANAVETTTEADHVLEGTTEGYTVVTTPTSFVVRRNGSVVQNSTAEVLATVPYMLLLDSQGDAKETTGFERLPEIIDSALDSTAAKAVLQRVSVQEMANFPVAQWNGRNGFRSSSEGEVGEMLYDQSDYDLPGGPSMKYYTAKQITDTLRIDDKLCARLVISADSNPDSLAQTLDLPIEKLKDAFALTDDQRARASTNEFRLHSRVELVWEIDTGLMHSEQISRHVKRTASQGGATSTMESVEDETTTYRYTR